MPISHLVILLFLVFNDLTYTVLTILPFMYIVKVKKTQITNYLSRAFF